MRSYLLRSISLLGLALLFAACSKGGELVLEPGARVVKNKGAPYVTVNQGGKALIVQQGQTSTTGIHGWVAIQAVSGQKTTSATGHNIFLGKATAEE